MACAKLKQERGPEATVTPVNSGMDREGLREEEVSRQTLNSGEKESGGSPALVRKQHVQRPWAEMSGVFLEQ